MAHAQKPDFVFPLKRTSPFKSAGTSVQSTAGSRVVRISGNNAGYTTLRGSVSTGYPLHSRSFPFTSPPVRHRVTSGFKRTIRMFKNGVCWCWVLPDCGSLYSSTARASRGKIHTQTMFYALVCVPGNFGVIKIVLVLS